MRKTDYEPAAKRDRSAKSENVASAARISPDRQERSTTRRHAHPIEVAIMEIASVQLKGTGFKFSRVCGSLQSTRANIEFQLMSRQMRGLATDMRKTDLSHLNAEQNEAMAERVKQLHIQVTSLVCADSFFWGIVCQAQYLAGGEKPRGVPDHEYFQLYRSGRESWSLSDVPGFAQTLYSISPRKCTLPSAS
jgi:hypothetical protein